MATEYPLADNETMHYAPPTGFVLAYVEPQWFLDACPSLRIADPEEDRYIMAFVEHIRDGLPLDAPVLSFGGEHDGRHRATAAKIAGVEKLPVYLEPEIYDFFFWKLKRRSEMKSNKEDAADFAAFCRNATDRQLIEIEALEIKGNRPGYAEIARTETKRRQG